MNKSYKILGVEVHPTTISELNNLIVDVIKNKVKTIITYHNLHSVYVYKRDSKMRSLYEHAHKLVDGMPFIIMGKLLGYPLNRDQRITGVDYMVPFLETVAKNNLKLFFVGSTTEVVLKAIEVFKQKIPGLNIDYHHGFFNKDKDSEENLEVINKIKAYNPDILLIGMGMSIQEHWVYDNLDNLKDVKVTFICGATFEYFAGAVSTPPRGLAKLGFEWIFRLIDDPKRFYKRYCIEPWYILPLVIKDLIRALIYKFKGH